MRNFKAKIGAEVKAIAIPTTWTELTVKQFQALALANVLNEELEVLTGVPAASWKKYFDSTTVSKARPIIEAMGFLRIPPNLDGKPIPPELYLMGRIVKPIKDVETMPVHGFQNILSSIQGKRPEDFIQMMHTLAGHGLAHSWNRGDDSESLAEALAKEILNKPVVEYYPVASFFCFAVQKSAQSGQQPSLVRKIQKLKRKLLRQEPIA